MVQLDMVSVSDLDGAELQEMFILLQSYFDGVRWETFRRDLSEKDQVMLLRDGATKSIVGFSTLMHFTVQAPDGPVMIVFSGDTVVEESSRSYCGFGYGLDIYFRIVRQGAGSIPVYYALISKGWRTYRVLPFLFRKFFPSCENVTPGHYRGIANVFGAYKYPRLYDVRRGIVSGTPDGQRIRRDGPDVLSVHRLADPHVNFFAIANPHHWDGDELVCIADVNPSNYSPAFLRMVRRYQGR